MSKPDDTEALIRRQHALREWHTHPQQYPREFTWHEAAGHFDHILKPGRAEKGAA